MTTLCEKTCFQRGFEFFNRNRFIKKKVLKRNQKIKLVKEV